MTRYRSCHGVNLDNIHVALQLIFLLTNYISPCCIKSPKYNIVTLDRVNIIEAEEVYCCNLLFPPQKFINLSFHSNRVYSGMFNEKYNILKLEVC